MDFDTLGDWCKWLEKNFTPEIMIPTLPVIIRLDGNNFSKWTKGLEKPFDKNLTSLMVDTTRFLVDETNAVIGYTQSDEITLILYSSDKKKSIYNDGKKQKILSKLTAKCVNYFNEKRKQYLPNQNKIACFDCRIFQTPTLADASNQLLWRELDATKNSISLLAQSLFSHGELQNLNSDQLKQKMLEERDIVWENLESKFKRGTYIQKITTNEPFNREEIEKLPLKHNARKNPDLIIERNTFIECEFPIMSKITNKADVIFNGANPILSN